MSDRGNIIKRGADAPQFNNFKRFGIMDRTERKVWTKYDIARELYAISEYLNDKLDYKVVQKAEMAIDWLWDERQMIKLQNRNLVVAILDDRLVYGGEGFVNLRITDRVDNEGGKLLYKMEVIPDEDKFKVMVKKFKD